MREARADKVIILGVDGLDPRAAKKYMDEGKMPALKQFVERGACREDLVLLGGHPTVTPPMWTTLATGCNPNVHGITDFYRKGRDLDEIDYNLDSRNCKAEPLWNVTAEAGKKTLVWHWPGSSWPPTSDNENLYVVDGTTPGSVNMGSAQVEMDVIVVASDKVDSVTFKEGAGADASTACVITDLNLDEYGNAPFDMSNCGTDSGAIRKVFWKHSQTAKNFSENLVDMSYSPVKPAEKWANAPEGANEFTVLLSKGLVRRPALILKNDEGKYDRVAIYKSKKDEEPIVTLELGKMTPDVFDVSIKNDTTYEVNRNMKLLEIAEDGSEIALYVSGAMDIHNDTVWHPKRLFKDVAENVGFPPPTANLGCQSTRLITDCMLDNWNVTEKWQADALHYLIAKEDFDVIFSHYHAVDLEVHMFIKHMSPYLESNTNPVETAIKWHEDVYKQTDTYFSRFLHLLDEGWTVIITSDHGLVASTYDVPLLTDLNGVSAGVMGELGYTVQKRDENGELIGEIDWTQTRAVMQREGHVYLNLKGRNQHTLADGTVIDGIVDPADQYELEEQIMTDLYGYKDAKTGKRIVSVALRNKDAVLLGMGGPECGDILVWNAEGYNFDHGDCLSTTYGENDTSVSPIFVAAGKGIKKNFITDRYIREVDVAPTVAILTGVRMPAQCEGAPAYQIFEEEV